MRIYFMGICGTAMAHLALILKEKGHYVFGSDVHFCPPISDVLTAHRIACFEGFDLARFKELQPDAVIVGNVISRGNPEVEYLLNDRPCPFYSLPECLERFILPKRSTFVVTGTHGKTTTTTLLTYLLKQFCNPGYLIGGIPKNFDAGAALGCENDPFVLEGDEYDTAFFDKRSKFFHYWPNTLIINKLEFDHADIFENLRAIQRSFYQLMRMVPARGHIIVNGDDENVLALGPCEWTQMHSVGFGLNNDWQIRHFEETELGSQFDLFFQNTCVYRSICSPLMGKFNAHNLSAALVACYVNGYKDINLERIKLFRGVCRRQVCLHPSNNLIVFDDFAHHSGAVKNMLSTLRERYRGYDIIACFEPACNTSASSVFAQQVEETFKDADEVWFAPVKNKIYCDRFVKPLVAMDVNEVAQRIQGQGKRVKKFTSLDLLAVWIKQFCPAKPTVLCCFSNGRLSSLLQNLSKD